MSVTSQSDAVVEALKEATDSSADGGSGRKGRLRRKERPRKVKVKQHYDKREVLAGYLFISPWIIGFLVFTAGAMVYSLYISFSNYNLATNVARPVGVTNYANLFLLILGSTVVGYLTEQTTQMARDRMRAERTAAVTLERARLARVVHDGVLQVLALVQRRGTELGGEAAELGRLAGEQETALRTLVQRPDPVDDGPDLTRVDLSAALGALEARPSPRVQVTTPGGPVMMSADRVEEVVALVRACLHNISEHVAAEATAWILLEDLGERVVVTVRDDGPGIPEGRLEEAAAAGRLGVLESIRGRAEGLGGAAVLTTAALGPGTWLTPSRQKRRKTSSPCRIRQSRAVGSESRAGWAKDGRQYCTRP